MTETEGGSAAACPAVPPPEWPVASFSTEIYSSAPEAALGTSPYLLYWPSTGRSLLVVALSQWPEVADHCRLVKAVAAEQVDVFPQQRREMRPRVVGDMLADAREMFGGSREVAGVPHNDSVDDKALGRSRCNRLD